MNNNFVKNPRDVSDRKKDMIGNMTNISPSELSLTFFSENNINKLQIQILNKVKEITFKKYGKRIKILRQKRHLMLTIMRYIYLENSSKHFVLENKKIEDQVIQLNKIFLKKIIPTIMQGLISYIKYLNKYDNIPEVNERPKQGVIKRGIINEYINLD